MAVAGNTEVVCAKLRAMRSLELDDTIHDILITLGKQYHIIPPLAGETPFCVANCFRAVFQAETISVVSNLFRLQ
ncbi:MAG: hypothetical protein ACQER6_05605 [Pseudomonadota bacterium]